MLDKNLRFTELERATFNSKKKATSDSQMCTESRSVILCRPCS